VAVNHTKDFLYVTPTGQVHAGDDPPSGSTVLVCPGGTIDDHVAEKYGVTKRLGKASGATRDAAGNPIVVRGGRAIAADVLPEDDPDRVAVMEAAHHEDEEHAAAEEAEHEKAEHEEAEHEHVEPVVKPAAAKAIKLGDVEDKAVKPPAHGRHAKGK
jgi:hypothetical protein